MSPLYVYRHIKHQRYPKNWVLVDTFNDLADAEKAARKLCPKGREIYTEPAKDLPRAFFGSIYSKSWSAMISTRDIHEGRK